MNKILLTLVFAALSFTAIQEASAMKEDRSHKGISKSKRKPKTTKKERTLQAIEEYLRHVQARRAADILLHRHVPNPNAVACRKLFF